MTLDEAINYHVNMAKAAELRAINCDQESEDYRQLAEWLNELKAYREEYAPAGS